MRILVSGGGTAGHVSPILATVEALKSLAKDPEILYVGQRGSLEAKIAAAAGLHFAAISAGKFRRFHQAKWRHQLTSLGQAGQNVRDLFRLVRGLGQSVRILRDFKPDVVFVKGGYVGLPVGLAAGLLKIPYVIHESDIVPGLTNRILARRAAGIAVGWPVDKYKIWPAQRLTYTGSPVRRFILRAHRLEGLAHFKFSPDLPVVLVVGGSQGARRINEVVVAALPELVKTVQVLHQTGEQEIERVRFAASRLELAYPRRYQAQGYLAADLGQAMEMADAVVSRAGANAIAELAALAKPVILVPHPHLTGGHQTENATALARAGAARVIPEERLTPHRLAAEIERLVTSPAEQDSLGAAIKQFAVPDADRRLAKLILASARPGGKEGRPDV